MPKQLGKFEVDFAPLNRTESFGGVPHYGVMFHDPAINKTLIGWFPVALYEELPAHRRPPAPPSAVRTAPKSRWVARFFNDDAGTHAAETKVYTDVTLAKAGELASDHSRSHYFKEYTLNPR